MSNNAQMGVLYPCDPAKNVECGKQACFVNGGPCSLTRNLAYAKQPVTACKLVLPVDEEMAKELGIDTRKE